MFLDTKEMALTDDQAEHLKNKFAFLGDAGNASTAGVPPFSSDGIQSVHLGVPPPKDNVSSGASPSTHARNTGRGKKCLASSPAKQNTDTTASGSKAGNAFTAGVPPASSEEAQASHPVVPASKDNASADVSSSAQASSTRHGRKRLASEPTKTECEHCSLGQ